MSPNQNLSQSALVTRWIRALFPAEATAFNHPEEMAHFLCEQLRELTRATTALFFLHSAGDSECTWLQVCPTQQKELFEREQWSTLCPLCNPDELPVNIEQIPVENPLYSPLRKHGIHNLLRFRIFFDEQQTGAIVLLNLQNAKQAPDIRATMELLGPMIGTAIQNGLARQKLERHRNHLEELISTRTAELKVANEELSNSRRAALNMMEDAVLANKRMEFEQALFHSFMDTLPAAVYFQDTRGRFVSVNRAMAANFHMSPKQLIGKTDFDLYPQDQAKQKQQDLSHVLKTGQPLEVEERSGSSWHRTTKAPRYNQKGTLIGIYAISWDITIRKQAVLALEKSRMQYVTLLSNLPGMAYLCEKDPNWTMRFISQGSNDITGYAPQELVNNQIICYSDLIHPNDRYIVGEKIAQGLNQNDHFEVEYRITTRSGEERWVWERGIGRTNERNNTVIEGFISDITKRKKTEDQLKRLSTAIEQSPEAIIITDPNAIIEYVNPAFERITGYRRGEAIGKNPRFLQSGQHDEAFYQSMWKRILGGHTWDGRLINQRKDGRLYTEEASISPVRDAKGAITHYVAVKRDITDDLHREEKMKQIQKMEAVGQLAGGIAHDFNNILQTILGFSELLMLSIDESSGDPYRHLLEIQKASRHAADLTHQLLAFSRKQPTEFSPIDLNEIVKNTLSFVSSVVGENIKIKVELDTTSIPIHADPRQIERTILNLALNARDAMPEGGTLFLKTEKAFVSKEDAEASAQAQPGRFACFGISDSGIGMSPQTLEHIYEPFFSTKPPGKGTGLGMAAIYGILQEHNGWIDVSSQLGHGSQFKVFLPLRDIDTAPAPLCQDNLSALTEGGKNQRILVVEDDPSIRELSESILKKSGYIVESVSNAEDAEERFKQSDHPFDLLISDIILPQKNGAELAKSLTEKNPNLPVILCSGYSGDRIKQSEIEQRGFFFLKKPFSVTLLLKTVLQVLEKSDRSPASSTYHGSK